MKATLEIKLSVPSKVSNGSFTGAPLQGSTETFSTIGEFETEQEALNCQKYLKTKFCRVLLSIRKATQHQSKETWCCVPQQDFTNNGDIDWSKSIREIDEQLFDKYEMSFGERLFIRANAADLE